MNILVFRTSLQFGSSRCKLGDRLTGLLGYPCTIHILKAPRLTAERCSKAGIEVEARTRP